MIGYIINFLVVDNIVSNVYLISIYFLYYIFCFKRCFVYFFGQKCGGFVD